MTLEVNASCCLSSQWCLPFADLEVRLGYFYASSPNKILRSSTKGFFSLSGETCLFCCLNNHKIYEYHFQSLQVLILFFIFFPLSLSFFLFLFIAERSELTYADSMKAQTRRLTWFWWQCNIWSESWCQYGNEWIQRLPVALEKDRIVKYREKFGESEKQGDIWVALP